MQLLSNGRNTPYFRVSTVVVCRSCNILFDAPFNSPVLRRRGFFDLSVQQVQTTELLVRRKQKNGTAGRQAHLSLKISATILLDTIHHFVHHRIHCEVHLDPLCFVPAQRQNTSTRTQATPACQSTKYDNAQHNSDLIIKFAKRVHGENFLPKTANTDK